MFLPIEGGSEINIQGLNCIIPPEGYIVNTITKKLEYRGVYQRSDKKEDQYWERLKLPDWYNAVMKAWDDYDRKKNDEDPEFYDERLEQFKQQEWDRRLNGFWVKNNGESVYLTGMHYMYLMWWSIDIGYPKFRYPDLEYFYFLQYVIEDPNCLGLLETTKRRAGKTFRGGLFVTEYTSRTKMTNGTIQSKTGSDAKAVFSKAVVNPFRRLPKFFRPEYDMSLGVNPKTEMRFQKTNIKGKKGNSGIDKDELGSAIQWFSADALAQDGMKVHRSFQDEWAKTTECNIGDRHEVLRYCCMDDEGRIIGKLLYSSTVEKLETEKNGIQEAARVLWDGSDQLNKGENGRTSTGLYRFFMPASRAKNFDKYGIPDVEKTIQEILADRETVKKNPRALSKRIKKEPLTIEEAFSEDADECIFNVHNINNQISYLRKEPINRFRYVQFYRNLEDQKVSWRDVDPNQTELHWKVLALPKKGDENKQIKNGGMVYPGRPEVGVIGVDGYSNTQGGKEYGSKLSGWIYMKYDVADPENTGLFTGHIYGRPSEKEDMYNQILLCAEFMGLPVYIEFVADDYYTFFKQRGRINYLGLFPRNAIDPIKLKDGKAERHRGFPTTEFALTKQNDVMTTYIEHHCDKIYYEELLLDLLKFRPYKRTPSDRTVSAMIALVSSLEQAVKPPPPKEPLIRLYGSGHEQLSKSYV